MKINLSSPLILPLYTRLLEEINTRRRLCVLDLTNNFYLFLAFKKKFSPLLDYIVISKDIRLCMKFNDSMGIAAYNEPRNFIREQGIRIFDIIILNDTDDETIKTILEKDRKDLLYIVLSTDKNYNPKWGRIIKHVYGCPIVNKEKSKLLPLYIFINAHIKIRPKVHIYLVKEWRNDDGTKKE